MLFICTGQCEIFQFTLESQVNNCKSPLRIQLLYEARFKHSLSQLCTTLNYFQVQLVSIVRSIWHRDVFSLTGPPRPSCSCHSSCCFAKPSRLFPLRLDDRLIAAKELRTYWKGSASFCTDKMKMVEQREDIVYVTNESLLAPSPLSVRCSLPLC